MDMCAEWQFHYVSGIDDNTIRGLSLYTSEFLLVDVMCHREREYPCVKESNPILGNMYWNW
jgi:hypothetical protein